MLSVEEFEAERAQLTAVAFRMLGSIHDAEDAVQSTWIRAASVDADQLRNPGAWLTVVLTRVCLDQLRARSRRREEPLLAQAVPAVQVAADEDYLRREDVSRALMVVLGLLTPAQRVTYVLHDLFGFAFSEVATAMGISVVNAKKHASRARARIAVTDSAGTAEEADEAVVAAFLAAAAGGDMDRMVSLMTADCERVVDPSLVPKGTGTTVTGASDVAEETRLFADRIRVSTPLVVAGRRVHVIAPGGHPHSTIQITVQDGRVFRIDISRVSMRAGLERWER